MKPNEEWFFPRLGRRIRNRTVLAALTNKQSNFKIILVPSKHIALKIDQMDAYDHWISKNRFSLHREEVLCKLYPFKVKIDFRSCLAS